jgi:hypothetical protein
VGALVGGERARVLQAELARDLGVLVTEKGKAKAGNYGAGKWVRPGNLRHQGKRR